MTIDEMRDKARQARDDHAKRKVTMTAPALIASAEIREAIRDSAAEVAEWLEAVVENQ